MGKPECYGCRIKTENKTMKSLIVLLSMTIMCCISHAKEEIPSRAEALQALIAKQLPKGWKSYSDYSSIVIIREKKVTLLNRLGLPGGTPIETLLKEHGLKQDYIITLKFTPKLSKHEYLSLKSLRTKALKKISNTSGKERYGLEGKIYRKYPLPNYYNSAHSIYLQRTDIPVFKLYPKAAATDRDIILTYLETLIKKYGP